MPQTCTVCRHAHLANIDNAILRRDSLREISRQFGLSKDAVARHKAHLPATLVKAKAAQEVARADSLLDQVCRQEALFDELDRNAKAVQESAAGVQDRRGVLDAIGVRGNLAHKRRPYLELRGELTGQLSGRGQATLAVQMIQILMLPPSEEVTQTVNGGRGPGPRPEQLEAQFLGTILAE